MNMKKMTALAVALVWMMCAASASALTMTGLDMESVGRDWSTSLFFQRMEALTGVAVEANAVTEQAEYKKLLDGMLGGNVTADVLFKAELSRSQEIALLDAGAIIDLAPLIEENMPNLCALLNANPQWAQTVRLPDGRIGSLPLLNDAERQVCIWINAAWLGTLGLEMPQNVEELTQVLTAFMEKDPNGNQKQDEIGADMLGVWEMRWLLPYFGVVADDYNIARADGSAVFAPTLPQYRAFVEMLRAWVEQGILPESAFTGTHGAYVYDTGSNQKETAAKSGIMVSVSPYTHVPIERMNEYQALLMPAPDGNTVWRNLLGSAWTGAFAVTSACSDPAAALRWADALYSEEGARLAYAGVEGEDYFFNEEGYWEFNVDTVRTVDVIRAQVLMYTGTTMPGIVPNAFLEKVASEPDRHVIAQTARVQEVAKMVTRPYALDPAQQKRADELALILCPMVDKGIARFATGEVPLTDENWTAWLAEMEAAGSGELAEIFNGVE